MSELFGDHIPLMRPWLGDEETAAVNEVLKSGWISQGPKVAEFEALVANYVGAKYAVATNACTTSLHLVLRISGVGLDDDVICPSFTCMATANAIHMTGAQPVFADIDPRTFNIDAASVEKVITKKTKAILAVHQIGLPVEVDDLRDVAKRHDLTLIEDGACSLGATYKGKRVGGLGSPTTFSFHPRKMITTGEGGMLTTDDEHLAEQARILRSTGASISDLERHKAKGVLIQKYDDTGYNYRLTDMQAALGIVQMGKIDQMLKQRHEQGMRYDAAIAEMDGLLEAPYVPPHMTHSYSSYMIMLGSKCQVSRDDLLKTMADHGISCRIGIQPLHFESFYKKDMPDLRLPATEEVAGKSMFLPIFPGMTEAEQKRVIDVLKAAVKSSGATARR